MSWSTVGRLAEFHSGAADSASGGDSPPPGSQGGQPGRTAAAGLSVSAEFVLRRADPGAPGEPLWSHRFASVPVAAFLPGEGGSVDLLAAELAAESAPGGGVGGVAASAAPAGPQQHPGLLPGLFLDLLRLSCAGGVQGACKAASEDAVAAPGAAGKLRAPLVLGTMGAGLFGIPAGNLDLLHTLQGGQCHVRARRGARASPAGAETAWGRSACLS